VQEKKDFRTYIMINDTKMKIEIV